MIAKVVLLATILFAAVVTPAAAQNPRERRDLLLAPPILAAPPAAIVSPWPTMGTTVGQPQWGNYGPPPPSSPPRWGSLGAAGWIGVTAPSLPTR